jgi:predicted O-methyltransferase YrrM
MAIDHGPGRWTAVDAFLTGRLLGADAALERVLADSATAGLPQIQVSAPQGEMLYLIALMINAERILEIGTLGGYSTVHLARAVPPPPTGRVVTLEASEHHATVAATNLANAGLGDRVDVLVGPALDTLPTLADQHFDLVFIDADKTGYPDYLTWALRLTRPGSVIIADNVVRDGAVIDPHSSDASVVAVREYIGLLAEQDTLASTVIQTVGSKGYDGFALSVVRNTVG